MQQEPPPIPTQPEFITKDWLFTVLNSYRALRNLSLLRSPDDIKEIEHSPHPLARGLLSTSYQTMVAVDCAGSDRLQYRLYIKLAAREGRALALEAGEGRALALEGGQGRALALEAGLLEREVETLLRLLPALRAVGKEQGRGAEGQVKLPVAETMYGSHHPSGEGVLVAADLLAEGWERPPLGPGLPLARLVPAVEALARLHAASSALAAAEGGAGGLLDTFPHLDSAFYHCNSGHRATQQLFKELSSLARRVPGFHLQHRALESWRPQAAGLLAQHRRRRPAPPLVGVTHGSPGLENLLVRGGEVVLTDWKLADLGSPLSDIAFLLLSSTDLATRTEHRQQLLETFHFTFCSALRRLGRDPATTWPDFSLDTVIAEYDRCLFGAFLQAACSLAQQLRALEATFREENSQEAGEILRQVGRRAMDLVDEAYTSGWGPAALPAGPPCPAALPAGTACSTVVESEASFTLVLPAPVKSSNG